jgi:hypothetical protein
MYMSMHFNINYEIKFGYILILNQNYLCLIYLLFLIYFLSLSILEEKDIIQKYWIYWI